MHIQHFQYFMETLGFIQNQEVIEIGNLSILSYENTGKSPLFTTTGYDNIYTKVVVKNEHIILGYMDSHVAYESTNHGFIEQLIQYSKNGEADKKVQEFLDKHEALGAKIVNISDYNKPQ